MSFGPGARQMVENVIAFMSPGVTLTLRRDSTLIHGANSTPISALTTVGAAVAGAATLSLAATKLRGRLVEGATFTIAGDLTVYTVGADVDAVSGALTAVPISPVLAGNVAGGTAVTITQSHADQAYQAFQGEHDRETASSTMDGSVRRLELAVPAGGRAPKEKDRIVGGFDSSERVIHVKAHEPELGYPVRWTVMLSTSPGVA